MFRLFASKQNFYHKRILSRGLVTPKNNWSDTWHRQVLRHWQIESEENFFKLQCLVKYIPDEMAGNVFNVLYGLKSLNACDWELSTREREKKKNDPHYNLLSQQNFDLVLINLHNINILNTLICYKKFTAPIHQTDFKWMIQNATSIKKILQYSSNPEYYANLPYNVNHNLHYVNAFDSSVLSILDLIYKTNTQAEKLTAEDLFNQLEKKQVGKPDINSNEELYTALIEIAEELVKDRCQYLHCRPTA